MEIDLERLENTGFQVISIASSAAYFFLRNAAARLASRGIHDRHCLDDLFPSGGQQSQTIRLQI